MKHSRLPHGAARNARKVFGIFAGTGLTLLAGLIFARADITLPHVTGSWRPSFTKSCADGWLLVITDHQIAQKLDAPLLLRLTSVNRIDLVEDFKGADLTFYPADGDPLSGIVMRLSVSAEELTFDTARWSDETTTAGRSSIQNPEGMLALYRNMQPFYRC